MDFLDPKKKRSHTLRLYAGYFLMAIALAMASWILLFEASGNDLDRKTGKVIQNGLIFVNAHQEQAEITVNGKREGKTDKRLTVPSGPYDITLHRDGYRDWYRSFTLKGGGIERVDYPLIFPQELAPKTTRTYTKAPTLATQSPDRKWLVVLQPGSFTKFSLTDLDDEKLPAKTVSIPEALFTTSPTHKLEPVEWSTDNRHLLVKHTYGIAFEFVMLDLEKPTQSFNVNRTFKLTLNKVALRDKKYDKLHLVETATNTLRLGDVKAKRLSVIAKHVLTFKSYGDDILLYVTTDKAQPKQVAVNVRRGDTTYKLRELPRSKKYLVDITRYGDRFHQSWYMAVGTSHANRVYIYKDAFDAIATEGPTVAVPVAALRVPHLQFSSVSANTRFIAVQGGSKFAVYDAEHDRVYNYDTQLKLAAKQEADWMDGHRMTVISQDKLVIFDYDGVNLQTLTDALPGFSPFFDSNYDFMHNLAPGKGGQATLLRTSLRIPADE